MGRALGQFVEQRRTELGLTRRDVATRAELSYPYVSQIETGDREPALKALSKLGQVLEVPVEHLAALLSGQDWTSTPSYAPLTASALMTTGSPGPTDDGRRRDKVLMSLERRLRDVPPLERIALLNELIAQAVQELQEDGPQR